MRAQLIPLDGGPAIEIVRDLTVVGRKEDCDLRLDNKSVSKMHCVIVKTDGLLLLRDLLSTNGTRVNGQRVRRAALLPNDQIAIASFKFRIHLGPEGPPVAPHEHTQHMGPGEVVDMMRKAKRREPGESPSIPVKPNQLPDVYPEDAAHSSAS